MSSRVELGIKNKQEGIKSETRTDGNTEGGGGGWTHYAQMITAFLWEHKKGRQ